MERILAACDEYCGDQGRERAFVLVMRYSGLRIGDAIALERGRLKGNKSKIDEAHSDRFRSEAQPWSLCAGRHT